MATKKLWGAALALPLTILATGCTESGKLKVEGKVGQQTATLASGAQSLELDDGRLVLMLAHVRVREIEFEGGTEDDEREAELGRATIPLALDGSLTPVAASEVEAGSYHTVGLELRKSRGIVVQGSYDGADFEFTSDMSPELEFRLDPQVVVPANGEASVGVQFNVDEWFTAADGSVLNPADAANKGAIEQRILASFSATAEIEFEDDDD